MISLNLISRLKCVCVCHLRDIDKIEDMMQDITEQQDVAQEISQAISGSFGETFDEVCFHFFPFFFPCDPDIEICSALPVSPLLIRFLRALCFRTSCWQSWRSCSRRSWRTAWRAWAVCPTFPAPNCPHHGPVSAQVSPSHSTDIKRCICHKQLDNFP